MSGWTDVDRAEAFGPGEVRLVDADGTAIAVYNVAGEFYAIENVCTHDGNELASGVVEGDQVICPRHGARFCLRSGRALTPPAYEPVRTFQTRVVDGQVEVGSG